MYLKAGSVVRELRLVHIELLCLSVPVLVADRLLGSRIQRRQRRVLRAVSAAPVANRITVWIKVQKLDYADIDSLRCSGLGSGSVCNGYIVSIAVLTGEGTADCYNTLINRNGAGAVGEMNLFVNICIVDNKSPLGV